MFASIGSLYIVKTWDREALGRERSRARGAAAIGGEAPGRNVVAFTRSTDTTGR
ncbi:MAG: hypothetical protein ABTQ29_01790 [Siculibacillus sp.]